jgi:hypothetical protein
MLDRLVASLLLVGACRTFPALRLLPSSWLRPLLLPTARRIRSGLARTVLPLALFAVAAIALLLALL